MRDEREFRRSSEDTLCFRCRAGFTGWAVLTSYLTFPDGVMLTRVRTGTQPSAFDSTRHFAGRRRGEGGSWVWGGGEPCDLWVSLAVMWSLRIVLSVWTRARGPFRFLPRLTSTSNNMFAVQPAKLNIHLLQLWENACSWRAETAFVIALSWELRRMSAILSIDKLFLD